jgi:hypothetical protein
LLESQKSQEGREVIWRNIKMNLICIFPNR